MPPVQPHPNEIHEEIIVNSRSSSDELDPTIGREQLMDLG